MTLDFITLYVVVLLNAILLTIVWAVVYRAYDRLQAAGIWMAGAVVLALGGCALATEGLFSSMVSIFLGNALVLFGFCLTWVGIRRFQDRPLPWRASFGLIIAAMAVLFVFTFIAPNYYARNVVYAVAQSIPMALSINDLMRQERRGAGTWLATFGLALAIGSHAVETGGNLLQYLGVISGAAYAVIEPAVVLLVIFNGMLWNLGLVLMVIDRLYAALSELALHDELTGLANRRAFGERMEVAILRAQATQAPFALLVIDLDNFKVINDGHGHMTGDDCLVHVARTLQGALRPEDLLARTGGDEFCAILPATDADAAAVAAGRLVVAMRNAPLPVGRTALTLTLSIGAAQWSPGQSGDALSAAADAALYEAKAQGRDGHAVARPGRAGGANASAARFGAPGLPSAAHG